MLADFILRLHSSIKTRSKLNDYKNRNRALWLVMGLFTETSGALIFCCYKLRSLFNIHPEPLDGQGDVIVSMTSFPKRMKNIWMTIDMIMRQTVRPAAIKLYLAEADFPDRKLPASLKPYMDRGLEVIFTPEDLRSHLKYHYAFKSEADDRMRDVVTLDDDLFYPAETISRLVELHQKHPGKVCANIARHITKVDGKYLPYAKWEDILHACDPAPDMIALGFGGILYPKEVYMKKGTHLYDVETMRRLSYKADDLWLKACQAVDGILVACGDYAPLPPSIPSTQGIALSKTNCSGTRPGNDVAWEALVEHFGL